MIETIPPPQAFALGGALALRPGLAQERLAVGAATLSLLAAYAEQAPLAVLIDDAHWLDASSAQALLFAVRRLELAEDLSELVLIPDGAPLLVSARISGAFLRRVHLLDEAARLALALAATSDSGDLAMLERAASRLGIDLAALSDGESAGLVALGAGSVEFRHPLVRSAVYADNPRRAAARDAPRAGRRPPRSRRRSARLASGRRGGRGRRLGLGDARAGRRAGARSQRLRDGLSRV
jgi:hypothetical protein